MIEVRKREGESNESLIRRFTRKVQGTGLIIQAKKRRFREPELNKNARRKSALRRATLRTKYEYMKKIGKLDESQPPRR